MYGWQADKHWADRYLPEIERIVRLVAGDIIDIQIASDDQDQKLATDYIVTIGSGEIGCRIRRGAYWQQYGDITWRLSRPSGRETEVSKILKGYCRWYLYAWTISSTQLGPWVFIDLDSVRRIGLHNFKLETQTNHDNSSSFLAIPVADLFLKGCLVRPSDVVVNKALQQVMHGKVM